MSEVVNRWNIGRVDVCPSTAEGEDGDPEGPVGHDMDLGRATGSDEPIDELTAASQDAAAEHHRTGDGGGPDSGEGPLERGGRVVEDAVRGPVPVDLEHQPRVVGEPDRRAVVQRPHHRDDRLSVAGIRRRGHAEPREQERGERRGRAAAVEVGQCRAYDAVPDPEAGALVAQQPTEPVRDGDLSPVLHADRARPGPGDHGVPV